MFDKKIKVKMTQEEYNLIIIALNDLRTKQIKSGGTIDSINEVLLKLLK